MSHYEERLQHDLDALGERLQRLGEDVLTAQRRAVDALLRRDRELAYATILGDHPINRESRAIDQVCHAFVAVHRPSAGPLRLVSSALRLNVGLERIGDYAVTICREAVQLSQDPPVAVAEDIQLMADQSQRVLRQALKAWNEGNGELARGTVGMARQAVAASDKVFSDLLREGQEAELPLRDLFALLVVFNRLDRVIGQAKNICEETIFTVAGEMKAPKVYRVLFVDERDDRATQLAVAYARRHFPASGRYESAGWNPAGELSPACRDALAERGWLTPGEEPRPRDLAPRLRELGDYHVLVSLGGDPRPHLGEVPFHVVLLEWNLAEDDSCARVLEALGPRIDSLMTTLRGEEAS